jgi:hypothetical protein
VIEIHSDSGSEGITGNIKSVAGSCINRGYVEEAAGTGSTGTGDTHKVTVVAGGCIGLDNVESGSRSLRSV